MKECIQKAHLMYDLGLVRRGVLSVDLFFGLHLQNSIDIYNKTGDLQDGLDYLDSLTSWPTTKKKNITVAKVMLRIYANTDRDRNSRTQSEQEFSFRVGTHEWLGRFDSMLTHTDGLYVEENKTTKPAFFQTKPNDQFISYYIGSLYKFDTTQGVITNVFNLDKRCIDRIYITYMEEEVETWLAETALYLDFYELCTERGIYPKMPSSCLMYGPQYACPYISLCTSTTFTFPYIFDSFAINEEAKSLSW
jgi:hypothetical protein